MAASGAGWSERVRQLLLKMNNFSSRGSCKPFIVAGQQVGFVPTQLLSHLQKYPSVFRLSKDERRKAERVELCPSLATYQERAAAMERVLQELRAQSQFSCLKEWRDEKYEVMPRFSDPPLMNMERAATCLFGVKRYGVHINGFVPQGENGVSMWIARRSYTKQTYPGLLDNMVAGGISSGMGIKETLIKECQEEACIPGSIAARAKPVSTVSYTYEDERGIFPECQFVYDLEVPAEFVPKVGDGEVHEFYLWPLEKVKEAIATSDFKPNCALVALDFLIRHGHIEPDTERFYQDFVEGIHRTL
ncbi:thiamin pyrophosphokinase 2 [Latimeria chalumnae]|uniref:Thiamin pyrophosphokinase 2 n=1 Tax=Latimeria chalumnae TaxID=7897 RepID=H3B0K7_LATCH|nr:PREDICTED: nudix hydrolase 20, chloroplastic-like [Latimeria chalumnae]|eukprot:XP_005989276.1 PREDICTED: nudix hydrolase 20, chloroplastic-like [Latimeria chalumnae]